MRNLNSSVNGSNLINGLDLGAETTMNTKDFAIDDGSDGQVVENFGTVFPGVGVSILTIDLVIESINCCDLSE